MTKRQLQIKANKDFITRIQTKFFKWCLKKGKNQTQSNLIAYLIRHSLIDETIINRFMCLEYYEEELKKTVNPKRMKGAKILAVWSLEDRIPLKETTIKYNLNHHKYDFRDKPQKMP